MEAIKDKKFGLTIMMEVILLIACVVWALSGDVSSESNNAPIRRKPFKHSVAPTVSFASEEPSDLMVLEEDQQERIDRLLRESKFHLTKGSYMTAYSRAEAALKVDSENMEALSLKIASRNGLEAQRPDETLLRQANNYFENSDFDAAVVLYNRLTEQYPEKRSSVHPQIMKCYYNLGVIAMRRGQCNLAVEYFRQNLLLFAGEPRNVKALSDAQSCNIPGELELLK